MPTLGLGGARINYEEMGEGPGVLLVHGWNGSAALWDMMLPVLSQGMRAVAVDLPGHGDSGVPWGFSYTLDGFSSFLEQVRDALHLGEMTLVGHSMGGSISMYHAARRGEMVSRLVLIDSPASSKPLSWQLKLPAVDVLVSLRYNFRTRHSFRRMIEKSVQHPERLPADFLERAVTQASKVTKTALVQTTVMLKHLDLEAELAAIGVPVLVLFGHSDPSVKVEEASRLGKGLRDVRVEMIADCGHCPNYEYPGLVSGLITGFAAG